MEVALHKFSHDVAEEKQVKVSQHTRKRQADRDAALLLLQQGPAVSSPPCVWFKTVTADSAVWETCDMATMTTSIPRDSFFICPDCAASVFFTKSS